jgi:hypothetical protein
MQEKNSFEILCDIVNKNLEKIIIYNNLTIKDIYTLEPQDGFIEIPNDIRNYFPNDYKTIDMSLKIENNFIIIYIGSWEIVKFIPHNFHRFLH